MTSMTDAHPIDPRNVQLTEDGKLRHFLSIGGLSKEILEEILDSDQGGHEC